MFERLVPAGVVVCEVADDGTTPLPPLWPEEEALLGRAVPVRRREFAIGRACARQALADLGLAPGAIPAGPDRAPIWPPGVVGSITHGDGCCAAAAGRVADLGGVVGLGIDIEAATPLETGVAARVLTPIERARLAGADPRSSTAIFSAKEAVYKAWFPVVGEWLGFEEAEVDLDLAAGRFAVRLLRPSPLQLRGRVALAGGRVFAVAAAEHR